VLTICQEFFMNEEQIRKMVEALVGDLVGKASESTTNGKFVVTTTWKIKHAEVESVGEVELEAKWNAEAR
jgi:hypothetical protein